MAQYRVAKILADRTYISTCDGLVRVLDGAWDGQMTSPGESWLFELVSDADSEQPRCRPCEKLDEETGWNMLEKLYQNDLEGLRRFREKLKSRSLYAVTRLQRAKRQEDLVGRVYQRVAILSNSRDTSVSVNAGDLCLVRLEAISKNGNVWYFHPLRVLEAGLKSDEGRRCRLGELLVAEFRDHPEFGVAVDMGGLPGVPDSDSWGAEVDPREGELWALEVVNVEEDRFLLRGHHRVDLEESRDLFSEYHADDLVCEGTVVDAVGDRSWFHITSCHRTSRGSLGFKVFGMLAFWHGDEASVYQDSEPLVGGTALVEIVSTNRENSCWFVRIVYLFGQGRRFGSNQPAHQGSGDAILETEDEWREELDERYDETDAYDCDLFLRTLGLRSPYQPSVFSEQAGRLQAGNLFRRGVQLCDVGESQPADGERWLLMLVGLVDGDWLAKPIRRLS